MSSEGDSQSGHALEGQAKLPYHVSIQHHVQHFLVQHLVLLVHVTTVQIPKDFGKLIALHTVCTQFFP